MNIVIWFFVVIILIILVIFVSNKINKKSIEESEEFSNNTNTINSEIIMVFAEILQRQPSSKELMTHTRDISIGKITINDLRQRLITSEEYRRLKLLQSNELTPELPNVIADANLMNVVSSIYNNELLSDPPSNMILPLRDIYVYLGYDKKALRAMLRSKNYSMFEQDIQHSYNNNLNYEMAMSLFFNYYDAKELKLISKGISDKEPEGATLNDRVSRTINDVDGNSMKLLHDIDMLASETYRTTKIKNSSNKMRRRRRRIAPTPVIPSIHGPITESLDLSNYGIKISIVTNNHDQIANYKISGNIPYGMIQYNGYYGWTSESMTENVIFKINNVDDNNNLYGYFLDFNNNIINAPIISYTSTIPRTVVDENGNVKATLPATAWGTPTPLGIFILYKNIPPIASYIEQSRKSTAGFGSASGSMHPSQGSFPPMPPIPSGMASASSIIGAASGSGSGGLSPQEIASALTNLTQDQLNQIPGNISRNDLAGLVDYLNNLQNNLQNMGSGSGSSVDQLTLLTNYLNGLKSQSSGSVSGSASGSASASASGLTSESNKLLSLLEYLRSVQPASAIGSGSGMGSPSGIGSASGMGSPSGIGSASGMGSPSGIGSASGMDSASGIGSASGSSYTDIAGTWVTPRIPSGSGSIEHFQNSLASQNISYNTNATMSKNKQNYNDDEYEYDYEDEDLEDDVYYNNNQPYANGKIPTHRGEMVLIPELAWSVPMKQPPVCTSLGQKPMIQPLYENSSLLLGTPIDEDTSVGTIMPKFEYKEYINIPQ